MRHTSKLQFILAALCSILAVACDDGGTDADNTPGNGGSGGMPGGSAGAPAAITTFKITDFETPSSTDQMYDGYSEDVERGWKMAWFTYTDAGEGSSPMGMITPMEKGRFLAIEDTTRAGNVHVGNITGGNFKAWGAGMGFNFKDPAAPVNLSEFKGVSFWGKSGTGTYTLKVKLVDARNTPVDRMGTCVPGTDPAGMPKAGFRCDDVPVAKANLTNEWKRFDLTWDQFKPEGWGMTGITAPQTDAVLSIQFQVGTEASWNVSVDEVGLIQ